MRDQAADEARGHVRAGLMSEGIARFSPADRQARFDKDLEVVDATLDGKQFLFGTRQQQLMRPWLRSWT